MQKGETMGVKSCRILALTGPDKLEEASGQPGSRRGERGGRSHETLTLQPQGRPMQSNPQRLVERGLQRKLEIRLKARVRTPEGDDGCGLMGFALPSEQRYSSMPMLKGSRVSPREVLQGRSAV
jgi:hypothetical protein